MPPIGIFFVVVCLFVYLIVFCVRVDTIYILTPKMMLVQCELGNRNDLHIKPGRVGTPRSALRVHIKMAAKYVCAECLLFYVVNNNRR